MRAGEDSGPRRHSHGATGEPLLEPLLARYRYRYSLGVIRELAAAGGRLVGLDLGCGFRGEFVRRARRIAGVEFYGADLHVEDDPHLLRFDFSSPPRLPFRPNVVTMHAVLEHLEDPEGAVRYVRDALAPGGLFLFTVPSPTAKPILEFLSFRLGLVSRREIEDHKRYFDRTSCLALVEPYFGDVRHSYFQFGLNNRVVARLKSPPPEGSKAEPDKERDEG
jgi:SAM-dependent methyltransferase